MLRCKTVRLSSSNATIALANCPRLLWHFIFKFTWFCTAVTSISAASDFFFTVLFSSHLPPFSARLSLCGGEVKYWLDEMPMVEPASISFILFCASRDWRSCSSSFTKSIAPPIIDAWSPCFIQQQKKDTVTFKSTRHKNESWMQRVEKETKDFEYLSLKLNSWE